MYYNSQRNVTWCTGKSCCKCEFCENNEPLMLKCDDMRLVWITSNVFRWILHSSYKRQWEYLPTKLYVSSIKDVQHFLAIFCPLINTKKLLFLEFAVASTVFCLPTHGISVWLRPCPICRQMMPVYFDVCFDTLYECFRRLPVLTKFYPI